jgi:hypothetical protein
MDLWQAILWRLFGRCWAQGCGRRMWRHTPGRARRCENTPPAASLTDDGLLYSYGIAPEPVIPVSRAS